jgi:hypothetical protein
MTFRIGAAWTVSRLLIVGALLALGSSGMAAAPPAVLDHSRIVDQTGISAAWPANYAIWSWGEEILCGFGVAAVDPKTGRSGDRETRLARSLDGGRTWSVESPPELLAPEHGGKEPAKLDQPMDFSAPGFVMLLTHRRDHTGASRFWHSSDRGKTFSGPYQFPMLGFPGIEARTEYMVEGPRQATLFQTAFKSDGKEGRPFVARTTDGGLTWEMVGNIGPEPAGFAIMPSTVRLAADRLITALRVRGPAGKSSIDVYTSDDHGAHWKHISRPVDDTGTGNPASLIRLKDGRLCLTWGQRRKPFSIRAIFSGDEGKSWGGEFVIHEGGVNPDLGYPRTVQRPDGNLVTVFYFNQANRNERFLARTIWSPRSQ